MATLTLPQARAQAPARHLWLIAAFVLMVGAIAGGYALATAELQALYIGLAGAAAVAVLLDYRIGAILLVLLLPVSATSLFPRGLLGVTGLNPVNMLLGATLIAYLAKGRLEHAGAFIPRPLLWLYIVPIVAAGLLGIRHVDDIHPGFYDALVINFTTWPGYLRDNMVKPLLTVLIAVLVGAAVAKARKPEPYVTALMVGVVLLALVMFSFVIASGVRIGWLASPRARAFFDQIGTHANELGRTFVTTYALLLFAWWETKHEKAKVAMFAALGIITIGIVLTFSRNAFLGFFLVNGLFLLWRFQAKKLGLAMLGFAAAAAFAPNAVYRRLTHNLDTGNADAVSAGRIEGIWGPLIPDMMESPIWGQGLDSILWSNAVSSGHALFVGHPHNAYLQAVLDMGVIGLALLVAYYFTVWRGFRALGSNAYLSPTMRGFFQGACAALLAFALAGVTGGSLRPQPENVPLWMAIGIMYGLLARRPAS
ncbi:MAG TPA: O-antigen ligase family protein [Burkholderiales bacterium]|nr:O-antigen ligase family protein [Burkholderiales bacterium]